MENKIMEVKMIDSDFNAVFLYRCYERLAPGDTVLVEHQTNNSDSIVSDSYMKYRIGEVVEERTTEISCSETLLPRVISKVDIENYKNIIRKEYIENIFENKNKKDTENEV